ncbi:MAG: hypothetical protein ACETVZ_02560, partial [Phycisphaerae bacterium]
MDIVIKIIGIVFIAIAIVFLLKPAVMNQLTEFFKKGIRIYFVGLLRLALAVIFLLGTRGREGHKFWIIFAFGILFLISGVLIFMLGPEKCKSVVDWFQKQSPLFLRVMAIITLAIGAIIIYAA